LTMTDSTISGNVCRGSGCAMDAYGGYGRLTRCKIIANGLADGTSGTGGIIWDAAYVLVENSLIAGNIGESGGGLSFYDGALEVIGSTIAYNVTVTDVRGAGIDASNTYLTVQNSILWGNNASGKLHGSAQIGPTHPFDPYFTILYSCVQGWWGVYEGTGLFLLDPMFVDPEGPDGIPGTVDDDLRLSPDSPYINWGDPAFIPAEGEVDLDGQPRLQGCRVDLGAFETNTEQLPADFDGDDDIDLEDFARFQDCFHAEVHNPDWRDTCLCVFDTFEDSAVDASDTVGFWGAMTDPG
ncbi:MAG: right-handed parallel beta-helix repeat-containing protein, partial [Phycisphaerales bacterium]